MSPDARRRKTRPRRSICADQQEGSLLFSSLPEDVVMRVLSRLGLHDQGRCRVVCRKWNSLIASVGFRGLCSQLPPAEGDIHFPVITNGRRWFGFDLVTRKWRKMPSLTFLPVDTFAGNLLFCIESSDKGLLCVHHLREKQSIFVCNPMTKTYRELPEMLGCRVRPGALHLQVTQGRESFRLVGITCCQHMSMPMTEKGYGLARVEVYDSISDVWTLLPSSGMPIPGMLFATSAQSVLQKDVIYFLVYNRNGSFSRTSLLGYDISQCTWTKAWVLPAACNGPLLLICGERLMVLQSDKLHFGESLNIYGFEADSGTWTLETQTPSSLAATCPITTLERFAVVTYGCCICLTTLTARQVVVYDCRTKIWEHWPNFPCAWTCGLYNPPTVTYEFGASTTV